MLGIDCTFQMALNSNWVLSLARFLRKSSLFFLQKRCFHAFIPWPKHHSAFRKLYEINIKSIENKLRGIK